MLAEELIVELDLIEEPFVLVLDDLGFIKEPKVHELLTRILKQDITTLHLVLLTRRDPPLPLASLRAGGRMTEIRQAELKFTVDETASFLAKVVGSDFDKSAASQLQIRTEGWPAGLRLAGLAMNDAGDANAFLRELRGDTRHVAGLPGGRSPLPPAGGGGGGPPQDLHPGPFLRAAVPGPLCAGVRRHVRTGVRRECLHGEADRVQHLLRPPRRAGRVGSLTTTSFGSSCSAPSSAVTAPTRSRPSTTGPVSGSRRTGW